MAANRRRTRADLAASRILGADPAVLFGRPAYELARRHGPSLPSARAPHELFVRLFPEAANHAVKEADLLLDGKLRIFGRLRDVSRGPGLIDWNFRPGGPGDEIFAGDPKFPWEVARLAFLPRLGAAWFVTRDIRYAEGAAALLLDWTAFHSEPRGLHWSSALEVGIRLIAACQAFHFFRSAPAFKGIVMDALLRQVAGMAVWLDGHLSTDRVVAGNHLLGELAGLIVADLYFPELGEKQRLARNLPLFAAELERQVAPDGTSLEQSSTYGRFIGDFIVAVLAAARAVGSGVPDAIPSRASRLAEWLSSLTKPDGTLPLTGDNDNGRGVDWGEALPSHDARGVILSIAALLDDPGPLAGLAGNGFPAGSEIVFWWMGEEGLRRLPDLLKKAPTRPLLAHFPAGGHAVINGEAGDFVHVRCGPFGHGLPKPSAHSHADWMAPVVVLQGHEVLTDPGNYGYTTAGEARDLFRDDRAHSTFRVAGRPLAIPGAPFRWLGIPEPGTLETSEASGEVRLRGAWTPVSTAGDNPVACSRLVVYNKLQRFIRFEDGWTGNSGSGPVRVEWRWRLPPGSRVDPRETGDGFRVVLSDGATFEFDLLPPARVRTEEGWVAPNYAERVAASVVVVEQSASGGPGVQTTVLRPGSLSGETLR